MSGNIKNKNRTGNVAWTIAAIGLAALLAWVSMQARHEANGVFTFPKSRMEIIRADGTKAQFHIEVAVSNTQQEHGLMYRKSLAPDAGMLFLWHDEQIIRMWMKNTFIPLDMLFIATDGRITKIIASAVPHDLTPLSSDIPVRGVIEIGGGEAAKQNIKVGDKAVFPAFPPAP